jgi:hypothetical protein
VTSNDERLDSIIGFFDAVQQAAALAVRPVYAETCCCGGSVEVGREASAAERRRIQANFLGRHLRCTTTHDSAAQLVANEERT